ncbi:MAG: CYTH domain-containing protein [Candidatus Aenigmatarchaeota archaeon]
MIEIERTFLVKKIPDLTEAKKIEMVDVYFPENSDHPTLRLRSRGNKYEMTKKEPTSDGDASKQKEHTIPLIEEEFISLSRIPGKCVEKTRHVLEINGRTAEIDVFHGALSGLVLADFEFEKEEEKNAFEMPEFCLVDVTQELFLAGGMLCGRSYSDIEEELKKFGYEKL